MSLREIIAQWTCSDSFDGIWCVLFGLSQVEYARPMYQKLTAFSGKFGSEGLLELGGVAQTQSADERRATDQFVQQRQEQVQDLMDSTVREVLRPARARKFIDAMKVAASVESVGESEVKAENMDATETAIRHWQQQGLRKSFSCWRDSTRRPQTESPGRASKGAFRRVDIPI